MSKSTKSIVIIFICFAVIFGALAINLSTIAIDDITPGKPNGEIIA